MASSTKKRKRPQQLQTLKHYCRSVGKRDHYAVASARASPGLDHKFSCEEIIVIDSDDSDDVAATIKRRPSVGSADVDSASELIVSKASSSPAKTTLFDAQPRNLCIGPGDPPTFSPSCPPCTSSNERFGILSPTTPLDTNANCSWPDIDIAEWDFDMENQDGNFVVEPNGNNPEAMDNSVTCPVCDMSLADMLQSPLGVSGHVNECLDRPSTPTEPAQSSLTYSPSLSTSHTLALPETSTKSKLHASTLNRNAFSILMSSGNGNQAQASKQYPTPNNNGRRRAPYYKVLQGMPIAVDAFQYGKIPGVTAYFLTHAHSDHYTSLGKNWNNGPIYCSEDTANLVLLLLSVDSKWVHPLPMDIATVIPDTGGVRVTLIEANHCPGSCLFLFEGQQTLCAGDSTEAAEPNKDFIYLHCGDFRASPQHVTHPSIQGKKIDLVYLDTTYLDPKYTFPPQPQVISACADLVTRLANGQNDGAARSIDGWLTREKRTAKPGDLARRKLLVVVGTYSIGKERIVKAIAHALQSKVYCDKSKAAILRCQKDTELHEMLTTDPYDASVHIVPLRFITRDRLKTYADRFESKFSHVVGFRPTGWTYVPRMGFNRNPSVASVITQTQQPSFTYASLRPALGSTPTLQWFGVPYSEHSSFFELTCFALSLDWGKMIATVNVGSEVSREKMRRWVEKWEEEKRKRTHVGVVPSRSMDYW